MSYKKTFIIMVLLVLLTFNVLGSTNISINNYDNLVHDFEIIYLNSTIITDAGCDGSTKFPSLTYGGDAVDHEFYNSSKLSLYFIANWTTSINTTSEVILDCSNGAELNTTIFSGFRDDFEDGDVVGWTGDVSDFTAGTTGAFEGLKGGYIDAGAGTKTLTYNWGGDLGSDTYAVWYMNAYSCGGGAFTINFQEDSSNKYYAGVKPGTDELRAYWDNYYEMGTDLGVADKWYAMKQILNDSGEYGDWWADYNHTALGYLAIQDYGTANDLDTFSTYDSCDHEYMDYIFVGVNNMALYLDPSDITYSVGVSNNPPETTLLSPVNDDHTDDTTPSFTFNYVDNDDSNGVCELFINNVSYGKTGGNYSATSINLPVGVYIAGDLASTYSIDADYYNFSEENTAPAFILKVNFSITNDPYKLWRYGQYDGNAGHNVDLMALNNSASYDILGSFSDSAGYSLYNLTLSNDYEQDDKLSFIFNHTSSGNVNHEFSVDMLKIETTIKNGSNGIITVNGSLADGVYEWYINCSDGTDINMSAVRTFTIDSVDPLIDWIIPLDDDSSVVQDNIGSFLTSINLSDVNLYAFNFSVWNSSGSLVQTAQIINLNTTSYLIAENISLSGLNFGVFSINVSVSDDHTAKSWSAEKIDFKDSRLKIDDFISIMPENFDISDFDITELNDRVVYSFTPDEDAPKTLSYEVECDAGLVYRPFSNYKGHFVCGSYWLDFENPEDFPVVVDIIDYKKAVVYTEASSFNSIGGLNIISEVETFTYSNYCSEDLEMVLGACEDDNQSVSYTDNNKAVCCDVTGLESDCSILAEPYNLTTYQACDSGTLTNEFNCSIPSNIEFKDRMPFSCVMPDTQEYDCIVNVFENSTTYRLLQTNPQKTSFSEGFFARETEEREFFTSSGGLLNAYFTNDNLLSDTKFRVDTICTNGSVIYTSQNRVEPFYEGISGVANRTIWLKENSTYIILGFFLLLGFISILGLLWRSRR